MKEIDADTVGYFKIIDNVKDQIEYHATTLTKMIDNHISRGTKKSICTLAVRLVDHVKNQRRTNIKLNNKIAELSARLEVKDRQIDELQETAGISNKNLKLGKMIKRLSNGKEQ